MAASIFQDMVMQEAIRDKTIQVEKQIKDAQTGELVDPSEISKYNPFHLEKQHIDSDDEGLDDEEEKIMRGIRERRVAEMKNHY